jgi:broad specificity phosphatase PhoE
MADLLVVIRTGPTDYDLQGRIRGNLNIPLAPAGLAAARDTCRDLAAAPPVALYSATPLRLSCCQTR